MIQKINLAEKFSQFNSHWDPKIVGELNNQLIKLVKFKGDFDWHSHEHEDEMFLVFRGKFEMQLRDRSILLEEGEFVIIPRGVEHRPRASEEVQVILFEPETTINTGNKLTKRTIDKPERI